MSLARLVAATALVCAGCATTSGTSVPQSLAVPGGSARKVSLHAEGVQIYQCKQKGDDRDAFEWALKAPDAELTDASGAKAGKHYGGPTWEAADGSKVMGEVKEKAPSPDGIPWLLLKAKANEGSGAFSDVTFVQRLDTRGGQAPADGCDATHGGEEKRVPYTATYLFFTH